MTHTPIDDEARSTADDVVAAADSKLKIEKKNYCPYYRFQRLKKILSILPVSTV